MWGNTWTVEENSLPKHEINSCPSGFEIRPNTPTSLCRRTSTSAGCSSVIYPSNGMLYSQVCGTVRVHQQETPDGFQSPSITITRNGKSVNEKLCRWSESYSWDQS